MVLPILMIGSSDFLYQGRSTLKIKIRRSVINFYFILFSSCEREFFHLTRGFLPKREIELSNELAAFEESTGASCPPPPRKS